MTKRKARSPAPIMPQGREKTICLQRDLQNFLPVKKHNCKITGKNINQLLSTKIQVLYNNNQR